MLELPLHADMVNLGSAHKLPTKFIKGLSLVSFLGTPMHTIVEPQAHNFTIIDMSSLLKISLLLYQHFPLLTQSMIISFQMVLSFTISSISQFHLFVKSRHYPTFHKYYNFNPRHPEPFPSLQENCNKITCPFHIFTRNKKR